MRILGFRAELHYKKKCKKSVFTPKMTFPYKILFEIYVIHIGIIDTVIMSYS